jgi:hypothetical protein
MKKNSSGHFANSSSKILESYCTVCTSPAAQTMDEAWVRLVPFMKRGKTCPLNVASQLKFFVEFFLYFVLKPYKIHMQVIERKIIKNLNISAE